MRIIIGTLFIFLFLTNCAQTSQEHLQKKLETRTESDRSNVGDTLNGSIVLTGKMTLARATHTATLLKNGKVLIAGGFAASTFLSGAEIYDPSLKTFTSVEKNEFCPVGTYSNFASERASFNSRRIQWEVYFKHRNF